MEQPNAAQESVDQPVVPHVPRCPSCGERPARLSVMKFPLAGSLHAVYYCGNPECGVVFNVALLQVSQQAQPKILVPGIGLRN